MRIKKIVDEDFTNYKHPCMFICTISCSGKCCTEAGIPLSVCQNNGWRSRAPMSINDQVLCRQYLSNPITTAICFGGLEPFEQFDEVYDFIDRLRNWHHCSDTVIIYTGFYKAEILPQIEALRKFPNIIVKFGRYIPGQKKHYDEVLGVELASDNQYAEKIS